MGAANLWIVLLLTAAEPNRPKDIMDYFLLLPDSLGFFSDQRLPGTPASLTEIEFSTRDIKNGFLAGGFQEAESGFEVAMFRPVKGAPVIAVNMLSYGPATASELLFLAYDPAQRRWANVATRVLPAEARTTGFAENIAAKMSAIDPDSDWQASAAQAYDGLGNAFVGPWYIKLPRFGTTIQAHIWTADVEKKGHPVAFFMPWNREHGRFDLDIKPRNERVVAGTASLDKNAKDPHCPELGSDGRDAPAMLVATTGGHRIMVCGHVNEEDQSKHMGRSVFSEFKVYAVNPQGEVSKSLHVADAVSAHWLSIERDALVLEELVWLDAGYYPIIQTRITCSTKGCRKHKPNCNVPKAITKSVTIALKNLEPYMSGTKTGEAPDETLIGAAGQLALFGDSAAIRLFLAKPAKLSLDGASAEEFSTYEGWVHRLVEMGCLSAAQ
ncbi:MAG: hypothetical protein A2289_24415 [Deltaproteobacteria bacterium RIFOXYA12_FULL_58_15]|nr:MAG: hypothetical protein A2289_24415 [Deltaproteobacteria bacterium RIFOXYA12_FULL_58_15]OGR08995.1 MAG: hypothetical protein A2341_11665 [Deltaproteobacteria bacterium RIFOXYB12_FULL_58_9]